MKELYVGEGHGYTIIIDEYKDNGWVSIDDHTRLMDVYLSPEAAIEIAQFILKELHSYTEKVKKDG